MELIEINETNSTPIALALGFFDSVHNGHKMLIDYCVNSAYTPTVFTFRNNPQSYLGSSEKQCYTFDERVQIFDKIGAKMVISAKFDKSFMCLSGEEFLSLLVENFNIKMVVFGGDYTCGKNAEFSAVKVKEFFEKCGIEVVVVDLLMNDNEKIASRNIRKFLKNGDIAKVNSILPYPYFVCGVVEKGRNVGKKIVGYPTANIAYPSEKIEIKAGVYKTKVIVDGQVYNALTNVGEHPTFDDYNFNIESFLIDCNAELYGKQIKIEFIKYLREIKKFDNATQLKEQIDKDLREVLGGKND